MAENNRNQQQAPGDAQQQDREGKGNNQGQNASSHPERDQNPQDGKQWSNYQTRELGDPDEGQGQSAPQKDR